MDFPGSTSSCTPDGEASAAPDGTSAREFDARSAGWLSQRLSQGFGADADVMLGSSYLECSAGQPSCEFMQGSGAKVDVVLGATDLAASGASGVCPAGWLSRLFAARPGLRRMRDVALHEW